MIFGFVICMHGLIFPGNFSVLLKISELHIKAALSKSRDSLNIHYLVFLSGIQYSITDFLIHTCVVKIKMQ